MKRLLGLMLGFLLLMGTAGGCGSQSASKAGAEDAGFAGAGGTGTGGTTLATSTGGSTSGGSASGGMAGKASGGTGAGGLSSGSLGGTASGGTGAGGQPGGGISVGGSGGVGGRATGGTGTGGLASGGTISLDAGLCAAGETVCPGCTTSFCAVTCTPLVCAPPDAGCTGSACAKDAGQSEVAAASCAQISTQAACDLRSDCHSVFVDSGNCTCSASGCCARFDHCASEANVYCNGTIECKTSTPHCEPPYAVSYVDRCYEGCVRQSVCISSLTCPQALPTTDGAVCGYNGSTCVYQDCAGAGRTEANCLGGTWRLKTTACDSTKCTGNATLYCDAGKICVRTTSSGGAYMVTPSCIENTCGASPVSLQCIQGLSGSCSVVSDVEIDCFQPTLCTAGNCPP
jgi:hypothetical protein